MKDRDILPPPLAVATDERLDTRSQAYEISGSRRDFRIHRLLIKDGGCEASQGLGQGRTRFTVAMYIEVLGANISQDVWREMTITCPCRFNEDRSPLNCCPEYDNNSCAWRGWLTWAAGATGWNSLPEDINLRFCRGGVSNPVYGLDDDD